MSNISEDNNNKKEKVIYRHSYFGKDVIDNLTTPQSIIDHNERTNIINKNKVSGVITASPPQPPQSPPTEDRFIDLIANEQIKKNDKVQILSNDEITKVRKFRDLKKDAYVFEYTDPLLIKADLPTCIGKAQNDAFPGQTVRVKLRGKYDS